MFSVEKRKKKLKNQKQQISSQHIDVKFLSKIYKVILKI